MEKRISYSDFQSVKAVAKACNPDLTKREKVKAKIEKLAAEYKKYDDNVASLEAGIKSIYGFRVEELVRKEITRSTNSAGNTVTTSKYLPTDIVSYDTESGQFVVTIPEPETATVTQTLTPPSTEGMPGSDFDEDTNMVEMETVVNGEGIF